MNITRTLLQKLKLVHQLEKFNLGSQFFVIETFISYVPQRVRIVKFLIPCFTSVPVVGVLSHTIRSHLHEISREIIYVIYLPGTIDCP